MLKLNQAHAQRPLWGMASHHREWAQLPAHLELFCARLETKKDVNRARLWWLSPCRLKVVERNADSPEMASSGMVALLGAVGRGIPTQDKNNGCLNGTGSFLSRTPCRISHKLRVHSAVLYAVRKSRLASRALSAREEGTRCEHLGLESR